MAVTPGPPLQRKLVQALVLLAFCFVCAWWAMLVLGPERFLIFSSLLYLPFWIVLIPLIGSVGLAWSLGWRWRGIAFAALLVFLWPVMGFNMGHPEPGSEPIRLMTYNIKAHLIDRRAGVGGFDGLISEIHRYDPDIVVMQDARIPGVEWVPDSLLLRRIVGSRSVYAFGQYIVASRLPMRGCEVGSIAYDERPHSFVHCLVTVHGQDIDLYTAHLLSPRDGLNAMRWSGIHGRDEWQDNAQDRMAQAEKLAQLLARRLRPAIVAGDLNTPEQSLVIRTLLDTGLRDAFSSAGWGYGYTHGHSLRPHLFSTIRIDHVLVSKEFGVADCFVGGKDGSQHRPVIADIWLR